MKEITTENLNFLFEAKRLPNRDESDIKVPSVDDLERILSVSKRGKPPIEKTLINTLRNDFDLSDIAIYTALFLAKREVKPEWTKEDIISLLTDRGDETENKGILQPLLSKKFVDSMYIVPKGMDKKQIRKAATEAFIDIIKKETELINIATKYIYTSRKKMGDNTVFIHELDDKEIEKLALVSSKLVGEGHDPNEMKNGLAGKMTYQYFNEMWKDVLIYLNRKKTQLKKEGKELGTQEKSLLKLLSTYFPNKKILMPEATFKIKTPEDVRKYFNWIMKNKKILSAPIEKYVKRGEEWKAKKLLAKDLNMIEPFIRAKVKELRDAYPNLSSFLSGQEELNKNLTIWAEKNLPKDIIDTYNGLGYKDPVSEFVGEVAKRVFEQSKREVEE